METYTEKAIKAIATGNAPAEQAALEAVIAEAVKKAVKETRRQDQQQALHNTALLMENYRALKGYEGRAVDSADAARLQGAEIQGEAWLRSIRKNKARTAVIGGRTNNKAPGISARRSCLSTLPAYHGWATSKTPVFPQTFPRRRFWTIRDRLKASAFWFYGYPPGLV